MEPLEDTLRRGGRPAIEFVSNFIYRDDRLVRTLDRPARNFLATGIDYAVAGDLAVIAYGYVETTCAIEVLVTTDALNRFAARADRLGYTVVSPGRREWRDVESNLPICFIVTGERVAPGAPSPMRYPDPVRHSTTIDGLRFLDLRTLVRIKLHHGTLPAIRYRHLADVIGLIQNRALPFEFGNQFLSPIREKYAELWHAVEADRHAPAS
jgi:hypothetical protein